MAGVLIRALLRRRLHLPLIDPDKLRRDLDSVIDRSLWSNKEFSKRAR